MKTRPILVRQLGQFGIQQRTSDGYFNATTLLEKWNNANPDKKRHLDNFWKSTHLNEFILEIVKDNKEFKYVDFTHLERAEIQSLVADIKRGRNGGTWMNPYLFIKFAMYLSPKFEYEVIKFVYDNLIKFRLEGGDSFKTMNISFDNWMQRNYNKSPLQKDYMKLAFKIKSLVGVKYWNKASEKQNIRRKDLEQVYEFAFNNNLNKKETNRMIKFQLTKSIHHS